jgi:hypothetical protein
MGFLTPDQVAAKAGHAYARFLAKWVRGEDGDFFPYRLRARFQVDPKRAKETIAASEQLLLHSKEVRGWGYTVHRERVKLRDFGGNPVPRSLTIDTQADLLRLAKRQHEFPSTQRVVDAVRAAFPQLTPWLAASVGSLHPLADCIDDLVMVARYFVEHPWPDCYARQIPVSVDTKFIQRHRATLRQWLDLLLPPSAIDVNETNLERRFGLRDGQPHRAVRVLDDKLARELGLPFCEFSLPLRELAGFEVSEATVVIVENDLNLLTLPSIPRGLGVRGEGNAVNRLEQLRWLGRNRVLYWGDLDVEGFVILSRLRNLFPDVKSVLMDLPTLRCHEQFVVDGSGATPPAPTNLSPAEAEAFHHCRTGNRRLEQERILQPYVERAFAALPTSS